MKLFAIIYCVTYTQQTLFRESIIWLTDLIVNQLSTISVTNFSGGLSFTPSYTTKIGIRIVHYLRYST